MKSSDNQTSEASEKWGLDTFQVILLTEVNFSIHIKGITLIL